MAEVAEGAAAAGLFAGMEFAISVRNEEGKHARDLIEANGGTVVRTLSHLPHQTVLMERVRLLKRAPNYLAIDYIAECIAAGQLLDRERFMLTADWTDTPPHQRRLTPHGGGRRQYTNIERGAMLAFARNRKRDINQKLPRAFWELAARNQVTSHSAESMHEHYRKQLIHKTAAEKDALVQIYYTNLLASHRPSPPRAAAQPPSANLPPSPSSPPPRPSPSLDTLLPNLFTTASSIPQPPDVIDVSSSPSQSPRPMPLEAPPLNVVAESPDTASHTPRARSFTPEQSSTGATRRTSPPCTSSSSTTLQNVTPIDQLASSATPGVNTAFTPVARGIASDEQVDRMTELLATTTGMPRHVVTHALYSCSGNPRVAFKYLRGQMPLDCWTEDEDEWILSQFGVLPKSWSPDLVKTTIRQVIHTHGGTARPHTVQMVWQRLQFLTHE
ncbi:hypothetical protein H257_16160 [Aphanomyces astaci]|uniref:BRCT domain-containing protein n=1 Tax=Aphanomyces astaci TaxID=112090 RepID=W4FLK4_APHAT|nr:hypothetical protein H257_16160 [Aphanomyces astaci]ETV67694.1 hypothetical protein H257_16160 [Aphanomyces astaci]|eukprot:XP_009842815.1 hypothetical protein H257_16160 [Aphanomyces astaci]